MNISEKQRLLQKIKIACSRAQSEPTAELFVLIIYDLLKEFDDNAELKPIIESIFEQARRDVALLVALEKTTLTQMRYAFKKLVSYFTVHKITMHSESPWNPFKLFNGCEDGSIQVTNPIQERYFAIENILRLLIEDKFESGLDHTDFLSQFGEFDEQKENIKLDFAPDYFEYMAELRRFEDTNEHRIGYSWDTMVQIYLTRKSYEQMTAEDRKNGKIIDLLFHINYRDKLNAFMEYGNSGERHDKQKVFDLPKLKHHFHRLCDYAIDIIEKIKEEDLIPLLAENKTTFVYEYADDIRRGFLICGAGRAKLTGNGAALVYRLIQKMMPVLMIDANEVMLENQGLTTREKKEQVRSAYRTANTKILHEFKEPDFIICEDDTVFINPRHASSCRLSTNLPIIK